MAVYSPALAVFVYVLQAMLGPVANACGKGGMRLVDYLGESRVRENLMHGLGRGCWKRGKSCRSSAGLGSVCLKSHDNGLVETQPEGSCNRTSALLYRVILEYRNSTGVGPAIRTGIRLLKRVVPGQ